MVKRILDATASDFKLMNGAQLAESIRLAEGRTLAAEVICTSEPPIDGVSHGELAAAMRYFVQAFSARNPFPDKYDLLMDIATEEFSHLEIVGATIQMLLTGINGDLKEAAENSEIMQLLNGKAAKENFIHQAMTAPAFMVQSAGGPVTKRGGVKPPPSEVSSGDVHHACGCCCFLFD